MMEVQCKTGSKILFLGMDKPEKIKSIDSVDRVWMEEADQFNLSDYEEIERRIRSEHKKIMMSFNPVSNLCWIKSKLIDNQTNKSIKVVHTKYTDNAKLSRSFIAALEDSKNTNPMAYKVYCLGEWGSIEGAVFTNWDVVEEIPKEARLIGAGLDFGFSVNPSALVYVYECDKEFYYNEIFYDTGLTNIGINDRMQELGVDKSIEIIADCAEPKSITELSNLGWNILRAQGGPDSIVFGIQQMQSRRQHITQQSVNIIKEFETYAHAKDKDGNYQPKPIKKWDHAIDAIRYRITYGDSIELFAVV